MFTPPDDTVLMKQVAQAQTSALGELYDRYGRLVFSLALHIIGDAGNAEEITQDVFTQVWRWGSSYDSSQGKLIPWLASITRHKAIDRLRQQQVRPEGHSSSLDDDLFTRPDENAAVEPAVELNQQRQRVRSALRQLSAEQRQCLELAYFQGMTQQEIADTLNQPLGTVKTRIRLGMIRLREMLG
jgi:RNA polymerase sigma-70 factor (ECF subfamily)